MTAPFTVKYVRDGNYVRVTVHVPVTRELAAEFTQLAQALVRENSGNGSLVDVRGFPNVSTVHDNYEYSAWDLKVSGSEARMKRAVLTDIDDDTHDLPILAMYEAGYNVKKFTDEARAIAWLTSDHGTLSL